ncbi:MAG: sulfurtransferase TusA family protein [Phycisphaerae bacterium]|nr:sulfurtransferase TusA family protein [Phycisphaerae bacterium]
MAETVDARGLSCPQPVIMTRAALQKTTAGQVTVLVDTMTQVHNCTRAAQKLGWQADFEPQGDAFQLTFTK